MHAASRNSAPFIVETSRMISSNSGGRGRPKFARMSSISTPTTRHPSATNPSDQPKRPQNRSTARGLDTEHFACRLPCLKPPHHLRVAPGFPLSGPIGAHDPDAGARERGPGGLILRMRDVRHHGWHLPGGRAVVWREGRASRCGDGALSHRRGPAYRSSGDL